MSCRSAVSRRLALGDVGFIWLQGPEEKYEIVCRGGRGACLNAAPLREIGSSRLHFLTGCSAKTPTQHIMCPGFFESTPLPNQGHTLTPGTAPPGLPELPAGARTPAGKQAQAVLCQHVHTHGRAWQPNAADSRPSGERRVSRSAAQRACVLEAALGGGEGEALGAV